MQDTNGVSTTIDNAIALDTPRLAFRFGFKEDDTTLTSTGNITVGGVTIGASAEGGFVAERDFSPSYTGATIESNKFTRQYYTGSNTFPSLNTGYQGAFFSASRFILNDTLSFLNKNFETTELHLTINKGALNFAPGFNDERSMGTFEVDRGYGVLSSLSINDESDGAPGTAAPGTSINTFDPNGLTSTTGGGYIGHNTHAHHIIQLKGAPPFTPIGNGLTQTKDHMVLVDLNSDSQNVQLDHTRRTFWNGNENPRVLNYSGSAAFELSFLDKDHTLIVNVDKPTELFQGIGTLGMALIPEHLHPTVKSNLEFYLKQGGILTKSTTFQPKK